MFHLYCWRPIYKERNVYSYCVCLRAFQLLIPLWHILKYDQGLTPLLHPDNGGRSTSMNNGVVTYATDDLIKSSSKIRDLVSMWKSWTDSNTVMMMIFKTCIIASWSSKMTQHACFRVFFLPLPPLTKRKKTKSTQKPLLFLSIHIFKAITSHIPPPPSSWKIVHLLYAAVKVVSICASILPPCSCAHSCHVWLLEKAPSAAVRARKESGRAECPKHLGIWIRGASKIGPQKNPNHRTGPQTTKPKH